MSMSLRRAAPRLLSRRRRPRDSPLPPLPSLRARQPVRGLATRPPAAKKALTAAETEAALEAANESMRAYYSYPVERLQALKKAKFEERHRDRSFYFQLGLGSSLLCAFLLSPFMGRKIAYDDEFRKKYIPSWYDYSIENPPSEWTRQELNRHIMRLQERLHERAIAGDFAPEKLEEMRRNLRRGTAPESASPPGVGDDGGSVGD